MMFFETRFADESLNTPRSPSHTKNHISTNDAVEADLIISDAHDENTSNGGGVCAGVSSSVVQWCHIPMSSCSSADARSSFSSSSCLLGDCPAFSQSHGQPSYGVEGDTLHSNSIRNEQQHPINNHHRVPASFTLKSPTIDCGDPLGSVDDYNWRPNPSSSTCSLTSPATPAAADKELDVETECEQQQQTHSFDLVSISTPEGDIIIGSDDECLSAATTHASLESLQPGHPLWCEMCCRETGTCEHHCHLDEMGCSFPVKLEETKSQQHVTPQLQGERRLSETMTPTTAMTGILHQNDPRTLRDKIHKKLIVGRRRRQQEQQQQHAATFSTNTVDASSVQHETSDDDISEGGHQRMEGRHVIVATREPSRAEPTTLSSSILQREPHFISSHSRTPSSFSSSSLHYSSKQEFIDTLNSLYRM